jgi:hypothetical protein
MSNETRDIFDERDLTDSDGDSEISNGDLTVRKRDALPIPRADRLRRRLRTGHSAVSSEFNLSELLQSVRQLETLTKARLAERRKGPDGIDPLRVQFMRYGVCPCSCHFTENVSHTGEPCCGNARVAR